MIGGLLFRILRVEWVGHGACDRCIGDAEHRFLKADADLNMGISLGPAVMVVPAAEFLRKIAEHVRHAEAGGDASAHARQWIRVESSVLELTLVSRDLTCLGVVGHRARNGMPRKNTAST